MQAWKDSRLRWNPATEGFDTLRVSADRIWKPDIRLYNGSVQHGGHLS